MNQGKAVFVGNIKGGVGAPVGSPRHEARVHYERAMYVPGQRCELRREEAADVVHRQLAPAVESSA